MRIEYHRTLIADRVRNEALNKALAALIVPGETTVADIGAGTGLLGLMAAKLGAREVYLYEAAEVAGVAARALKRNRARNCHLMPCHSTEMADPPEVDLVVSETLGNYPFEENIIDTLNDARARFLRPEGIIIPSGVTQFVAPVTSDRIAREFAVWDDVGFDLDLSAAKALSLNNIYVRSLKSSELLFGIDGARRWDEVDFRRRNASARKGRAEWSLTKRATIYGFVTWWRAELGGDVALSTAPDAPRTHWEQLYFPLMSAITGIAGETISVGIRSKTSEDAGTHIAWTAERRDAGGHAVEQQKLDLNRGYLP